MTKIFKIIEKVVWILAAIAVIILALIAIGVANSADNIWDDVRPHTSLLYGVAILVVAFKVAILGIHTNKYQSRPTRTGQPALEYCLMQII